MFIKTPLLLFRQLPDVFLTMVKSFLYAKNKAKKYKRKRKKAKRERTKKKNGKKEKGSGEAGKREREKKKGKKDKTGKTERAKKEERKTTKSEMEKSRKLFAATRLTLGFLGTNFFTFIIMKNYIVGKGVLFL